METDSLFYLFVFITQIAIFFKFRVYRWKFSNHTEMRFIYSMLFVCIGSLFGFFYSLFN